MAASGYTPISLYYSTTASAVPTAGNLANGELALNIADMKLYAKNSSGVVTLLASNASTTGVDSLSFGSTGLTPSTATTGAITVAGTLNVANGGTGKTSYTANGVLYASGTGTLANGSALTFDGTNFATTGNITSGGVLQALTTVQSSSGADLSLNANGANRDIIHKVNATELMRLVGSTGNLGIGTTSPVAKLQIKGTGTSGQVTSSFILENGSSGTMGMDITGAAGSSYWRLLYGGGPSTGTNALSLGMSMLLEGASAGNVGFGTSSPAAKIHAVGTVRSSNSAGTIYTSLATDGIYSSGTDLYLLAPSGYSTIFYTNNTEKFRFGTAGQFGIGGANYGNAGEVLTSGGSGAAPTWAAAGGGSQAFVAFGSTGGL